MNYTRGATPSPGPTAGAKDRRLSVGREFLRRIESEEVGRTAGPAQPPHTFQQTLQKFQNMATPGSSPMSPRGSQDGMSPRQSSSRPHSRNLLETVSLDEDDDDPAHDTSAKRLRTNAEFGKSTPGGSTRGSMDDLTPKRYSSLGSGSSGNTVDESEGGYGPPNGSAFRAIGTDPSDDVSMVDKSKLGSRYNHSLDSNREEQELLSQQSAISCDMRSVPDLSTSGGVLAPSTSSSYRHRTPASSVYYQRPHLNYGKTGSSLPTSRVASPDPDQVIGGRGFKKKGTSDVSRLLVEKDVLESQLRKLQVEISTLHTENKLLKDKYNRGQARIGELEIQLKSTRNEAIYMNEEISDEMSAMKRRARDLGEQSQTELQQKIVTLTKQLEMIKSDNASLEKQLEASRRGTDVFRHPADRSRIIESFRTEVTSLREDSKRARQLWEESEHARSREAERRQQASAQVAKLTEMKVLLQQQLEQSAGESVAEKQVKSLERRLKITEDRLHQERADRASKLSDVEEKLILENATLQVSEKELKRQLTREREKHRTVEQKYRDVRDESERLRVQMAENGTITDNLTLHSKFSHLRSGQKKQAEEIKSVMEEIKKEENLGPGQEQDIIGLLWQRKNELARELKEWEIWIGDLNVDEGSTREARKVLRDERTVFEERINRYKDTLEDLTKEKEELDSVLRKKVHELGKAHHFTVAKARNLEDMNAAISAENDGLRNSLKMAAGTPPSRSTQARTLEGEVESLRSKVRGAEADHAACSRRLQAAEGDLGSAHTRLTAKEAALEEALTEISRLTAGQADGAELRKQQRIDKLNAEVRGLQAEVHMWQGNFTSANKDRSDLEAQVEELGKHKSRSMFAGAEASHRVESDKLALETELHEKDSQVLKLSVQYNECENELQRTKQLLLLQQQHCQELSAQMDQLQAQLRQKTRALDRQSSVESEHLVEIQALRDNLTTANRELSDKTTQVRLKEADLEQVQGKVHQLETDIHEVKLTNKSPYGDPRSSPEAVLQGNARSRLLEYERQSAKRDLERANNAMCLIVRENSELMSNIRELRQELVRERARLCQLASEKVELDQRFHLYQEDCKNLERGKVKMEADLMKLTTGTRLTIQHLQTEVESSKVDYEAKYHTLDAQGKKMAVELGTCHRLLEAREREVELLRDTIDRQKGDMSDLTRKVELLQEENLGSRNDIERLTTELTNKMKENAAAMEQTHLMASERSLLQLEKLQLENDMGKGNSDTERALAEVMELTKKLEKAEERQRDAERQLHQKETVLVAIETEMKHLNRNMSLVESEKLHLKTQTDKLNDEIRTLRSVNSTLEQRLSLEKTSLTEEKSTCGHLNQELNTTLRQAETLQLEYDTVVANLEEEKRIATKLQEIIQKNEDKTFQLEDKLTNQRLELDALKSHLTENKNTIDRYSKEKQTLYQDVQDLCRKLAEKDDIIARLQEKCNDAVNHLQKDFTTEKSYLTKEREKLETDISKAKEEIAELTDRVRQRDLQLDSYVHTNHDLENETKVRLDLESQVRRLESEVTEARQTLSVLQMDSTRKTDHAKYTKDSLEKAQEEVACLQEHLQTQREQNTREVQELRMTLSDQVRSHELERSSLQDQLNKALSNLRANDVSLSTLMETKQTLYNANKSLERSVDSLKVQLHEEVTGRKLAEQNVDSLRAQLDDIKLKRGGLDERNLELQATLAKVEAELKLEKDKYYRLKQEYSDERSTSSNVEAHAQALHTQVTELQCEVSSLRSQLETQKQTLQGRNKRLALEIKQQMENFDKERSKLIMQIQQLSMDLEAGREQVAIKNRESLRLQEEILSLEEQLREATSGLKHAQEALHIEEEHRERLNQRNEELELRIKARANDDSESSRLDLTRAEVNKMMQEMQRKMQSQMDQNKANDKEANARQLKQIEEYKKKISSLESRLNQEHAMHVVTRTQLCSLEEDNQRLRHQLQAARKRNTTGTEDRSKSRMEEINEIIARSQTRAQQMMATGAYMDDPHRVLNSTRELLSPIPTMPNYLLNTSVMSDGRSVTGDDISKDFGPSPDSGAPMRPTTSTKH